MMLVGTKKNPWPHSLDRSVLRLHCWPLKTHTPVHKGLRRSTEQPCSSDRWSAAHLSTAQYPPASRGRCLWKLGDRKYRIPVLSPPTWTESVGASRNGAHTLTVLRGKRVILLLREPNSITLRDSHDRDGSRASCRTVPSRSAQSLRSGRSRECIALFPQRWPAHPGGPASCVPQRRREASAIRSCRGRRSTLSLNRQSTRQGGDEHRYRRRRPPRPGRSKGHEGKSYFGYQYSPLEYSLVPHLRAE
jgi:hypothetical protein